MSLDGTHPASLAIVDDASASAPEVSALTGCMLSLPDCERGHGPARARHSAVSVRKAFKASITREG